MWGWELGHVARARRCVDTVTRPTHISPPAIPHPTVSTPMPITVDTKVRCTTEDFVHAEVDDELVFMDVERGLFYSLKDTGRAVWDLMNEDVGWHSVGALVSALCEEFEVKEETCLRDLAVLVDEMEEAGLVEVGE